MTISIGGGIVSELQNKANLVFLALVVWREARGETADAKAGVAHVVLSRAARPGWWGSSLTGVMFKKWQFSSMTDPRDTQLTTWPEEFDTSWQSCLAIADGVLSGKIKNPAPGADSYFDISITDPKWVSGARFVKQIGRLKFYDVDHKGAV